jgi:putative oxidoreductase
MMHTTTMEAPVAPSAPAGVAAWIARLGKVPFSFHQLLFRLALAAVFFKAGLLKVSSWESTVGLFRDEYRVPVLPPEAAAAMAASFELGCSVLLVLGLAARLATLPLLGMIAVIQLFVYPSAWPEHLTWGSILLVLLTRGAGTVSLDHVIARARGGRPR